MAIRRSRGISVSDSASSLWGWLVVAGIFAAIGYGVYVGIAKVNSHASDHVRSQPGTFDKKGRVVGGGGDAPKTGPVKPPPPPPRKDLLERAAGDINAAVLAKEAARYRGDTRGLASYYSEAQSASRRLAEVEAGRGGAPEHLQPDDEVTFFQDTDLTKMDAKAAGDYLAQAARSIEPGTYYKVRSRRKDYYLYFPYPAGAGEAAGERVKISVDFAREISQQVLSLGPDRLYADDRKRIERILGEGSASREDYAFLVRKLAKDAAGDVFNEKESFTSQIAALEKLIPTAAVPDAVVTKAGHRIPGQITANTPAAVSITTAVMPLTFPKDEIQLIFTTTELRAEFDRRLKTAIATPEAFPQLLSWTRDWHLPVHRELVAYYMLQTDRNNVQARLAANFHSLGEGKWETRGNIATGAPVPKAPKPETRAEIGPLLQAYGFTEEGGKWFRRVPWSTGIDTLHSPGGFQMKAQGLVIMPWREDDTPQSRDESLKGRKTTNAPPRLRFFAPSDKVGVVTIQVDAPAPLADCQVRAVGSIIEQGHGARVEVVLTPEGGKATSLYTIDSGGNDAWFDVTPQVDGKKRFTVTARVTTTKDTYHAYARFLPSVPESKQVFWVRGTILQAAPEADRAWIGARP